MGKPDNAGIHVPPPLIYVTGFLLGVWLHMATPAVRLPDWVGVPGILIGFLGLVFGFCAIGTFWLRKTAVLPHQPATTVVCQGPFRFCRNPMYLGLAAVYLGLDLFFRLVWPLLFLPACMFAIQRFVIRSEEAYLERAFGEEYRDYCRRVGRWFPKRPLGP